MKIHQVFLGFAIVLLLFFRFINLENRVIFDWDQESYAKAIRQMTLGDFTLLGPRTTHDRGFFLGPQFTYLMAPFYAMTGFHPAGSILFLIVVNLLFAAMCGIVLTKIFGYGPAGFFTLLWAMHPYMVEYDVTPWWPVLLPIGIIATFYCLYRIVTDASWHWWLILGLICGLMMQMHFQFVFYLIFTAVFLLRHMLAARTFPKKHAAIAGAGFASMFLPLLVFDLRNNFFNSKAFLNFFFGTGNESAVKAWDNWMPVFANMTAAFSGTSWVTAGLLFYGVVLAAIIFQLWRASGFRAPFYTATLSVWLLFPVFFAVYGQRPSEYYFISILPLALLTLCDLLWHSPVKPLLAVFVLFYMWINIPHARAKTATHPYGLAQKERLVRYLHEHYDPKDYIVSFNVELGREPGFRYLMERYGIVTHDKGDANLPLVQVKIPPESGDVVINEVMGLQIPEGLRKRNE